PPTRSLHSFPTRRSSDLIHVGQSHAQQVPNSVGTEPPKLKAPANAADCHMHTYDPARFPMPPNPRAAPTNATVEDYRLLQKRIGTTRVVIVQQLCDRQPGDPL